MRKFLRDMWWSWGFTWPVALAVVVATLMWWTFAPQSKGQYVPPYQRQQVTPKFEVPKVQVPEHPLAVPADGKPVGWEAWPSKRWWGLSLDQAMVLAGTGWVFVGLGILSRMKAQADRRREVGL